MYLFKKVIRKTIGFTSIFSLGQRILELYTNQNVSDVIIKSST